MSSEQFIPLNDVKEMKRSTSRSSSIEDLEFEHQGLEDTLDYRLQAVCPENKQISLWHDISLVSIDPATKEETPYLNFVCEIPKFTRYESSPPVRLVVVCFSRILIAHSLLNFQKEVRNCYR
jgi:hypothetical protein